MRRSVNLSLSLIVLVFAVMLLPGTGWATTIKNRTNEPVQEKPTKAAPESGTVNPVYFFDDFENGLSNWTESTGFWGLITTDYRSVTNSVSASPGADYPENVNASLTLALSEKLNLSAATSPVLTFWHKYSIASYSGCCNWSAWDYGYVEYSTNYGVTWTKLSNPDTQSPDSNGPGFTGNVSSWYPEEFDLTAIPKWNSLPIMIRFRLWNSGHTPTSWGWLIDDVEVKEKGTTLNVGLTVSIPSGGGTVTGGGINCPGTCSQLWPANWTLSGREWALEDSVYEVPPAAISAVPDFPNGGAYAIYANSVLEQATPVSLAGATAPTLSIYTQYSIGYYSGCCNWSAWDYGYVEYSTNYGTTWTPLSNQDTVNPNGVGPGFNGTVSSWTQEQFDLTQITNWQTLPILIRFRLWNSGHTPSDWGWLIDEPEIYDPATGQIYFGPDTFTSGSLPNFSDISLTATPNADYTFGSWTGCNSTSGNECTINRYIDRNVTANFTPCTPPNCNNSPGPITVSPGSLTFSKQPVNTTSKAQSVTVTNPAGNSTVTFSSIATSPTANFNISSNTCGTTLTAGAKCKVGVTYTATAVGTQAGTLTFTDNAQNNPQIVTLTGTGEVQATLTPTSYEFAKTKVGTTSKAKAFTLKNNLSTTLTGISYSTTGDFAVSASTCGTTLNAGKSCTIDVTFTPTQTGALTGTLTVNDSANNSPQKTSLSGTGD
ncbi:MAG: choice-of-anchor D domain-containing protein [Terriglobales bacterium]